MSDLAAIGKASESRWTWLRYLFGSRLIVQELLDEIERGLGLEGRIDDLKDELDEERQKTANMAAVTDALEEAVADATNAKAALLKTCAQRDALQERVDTLQANCDQNVKAQADCAAAQEWARQIEADGLEVRKAKHDAEARIVILEARLKDAQDKVSKLKLVTTSGEDVSELWKIIQEKDEAIHHLVRWIQTAHRTTPMPEPNTIKRLLFNAQNSRRQ